MMMKVATIAVLICVALLARSRTGAQDGSGDPPIDASVKTGALALGVADSSGESSEEVQVSVQSDGAPVSGSADVVGFPIIHGGQWGDIDWKVSGSTVTGIVRTSDGQVEGTYEGTITPTGVSGTFTHSDGRVGLWSWNGPPPQ